MGCDMSGMQCDILLGTVLGMGGAHLCVKLTPPGLCVHERSVAPSLRGVACIAPFR